MSSIYSDNAKVYFNGNYVGTSAGNWTVTTTNNTLVDPHPQYLTAKMTRKQNRRDARMATVRKTIPVTYELLGDYSNVWAKEILLGAMPKFSFTDPYKFTNVTES